MFEISMLLPKITVSEKKPNSSFLKKCLAATFGILGGGFSFWGLMQNPAAAASMYQTTFTLDSPEFSSMVFDWSGSDSGDRIISEDELESWSITLFDSNNNQFFVDQVVSQGTVLLTEDGRFREIMFEFFTDSSEFSKFSSSNAGNVDNKSFAFIQVQKFPNANLLLDNVDLDGSTQLDDIRSINIISESTTTTSPTSTPEPSLMLGFITLGGLMLGSKRKTKG